MIAMAFSRGFVKDPEDDALGVCMAILQTALLDQRVRELGING